MFVDPRATREEECEIEGIEGLRSLLSAEYQMAEGLEGLCRFRPSHRSIRGGVSQEGQENRQEASGEDKRRHRCNSS